MGLRLPVAYVAGFSYVWDYALSKNCKLLAADGEPAEDDESAGGSTETATHGTKQLLDAPQSGASQF